MVGLFFFAVLFSFNGVLLQIACWFYNQRFAGAQSPSGRSIADPANVTAPPAGKTAASVDDDTNPYSPPRQLPKPRASEGAQITLPTVGASIGLGFLLTTTQLFIFGVGLLWPMAMEADVNRTGIIVSLVGTLVVLFAVTAVVVTSLLTDNFARGLIVTGIYYGLILAIGAPLVVLGLIFSAPL